MTQENEPTQTSQSDVTAEQATAKAVARFQAVGETATSFIAPVPTVNITPAPEASEPSITKIFEDPKPQQ